MHKHLKAWLIVFLILLAVGIYVSLLPLIWGSLLAVSLLLLSYIWSYFALHRMDLTVDFSSHKITAGEETEFVVTLENCKPLPVFWLKAFTYLSGGIDFKEDGYLQNVPGSRQYFEDIFRLNWYQRVKREYKLKPAKRGRYEITRSELAYKGFLGLVARNKGFDSAAELLVYPRLYSVVGKEFLPRQPLGTNMSSGWIFEDRTNIVGVRDYQSGDDFKRINWKISARHNKLKSDIYNPSLQKNVEILLDIRTSRHKWEGYSPPVLENLISLTGSLAQDLLQKNYAVGLVSNGILKKKGYLRIEPEQKAAQLEKMLTCLASLRPIYRYDIEHLIDKITGESEVILITARPDLLQGKSKKFPSTTRLLVPGSRTDGLPAGFRLYKCKFVRGSEGGCYQIQSHLNNK